MLQPDQKDIALATLRLLQAGFWPDGKSIEAALKQIEALQADNEKLRACLNPFAKMGAKIEHSLDMPALIDYGNLQITGADLKRAAAVLYGKGVATSVEEKE